ncbi:hypothetical protein FSP39_014598 [Pinctada imbricata]|uniref:B box-type domain-containing protein n=1 Tax=Pinctada imbricata TaxID=66713 RepID=A0AA88YJJ3_PINIB|nr:hypothetical protein FSP39_014598 [Pinctada imbricata]
MAESQQWTVQCTHCMSSVEYHCNTCDSSLCSDCTNKHKGSEENTHHLIVRYSERFDQSTHECKEHPGSKLVVWCDTCNMAVCTDCVTSENHKKHEFKSFQDKAEFQRKSLRREYESTKHKGSMWQECLSTMKTEKEATENKFNDLEYEVKEQTKAICNQVHHYEMSLLNKLEFHKKTFGQFLSTKMDTIVNGIHEFQQEENKYETILRSKDAVALLEFKSACGQNDKPLPKYIREVPIPIFKKGSMFDKFRILEEIFGQIVLPNDESKQASEMLDKTFATDMHIIHTGRNNASPIVCNGDDQTWVVTEQMKIQLIDKSNNISKQICFAETCCDVGVTSDGDILFIFDGEKSVWRYSRDETLTKTFSLHLKPHGICALNDGNILIIFKDDKKVIMYSRVGMILMALDSVNLSHPLYATQNMKNNHIYVTDKTDDGHYSSPGRVFAIQENGDLLYEYTGQDDVAFTPVDVCSDSFGQVFVTDYLQGSVHILNEDGVFLRFLHLHGSQLENPCRIDINDNEYVWISENSTGKLKVVRLV